MLSDEQLETLRAKLERVYQAPVSRRRIRAIRTNSAYRWQPPLYVEVGCTCAVLTKDGPPELVVAIFESDSFLVCTPDHGAECGSPHIFTRADVRQVIYSDKLEPVPGTVPVKRQHDSR
ncbi:MAG: hypothetical protein AB1772_08920 [Candidatus Zixiibacteriota bacterium]